MRVYSRDRYELIYLLKRLGPCFLSLTQWFFEILASQECTVLVCRHVFSVSCALQCSWVYYKHRNTFSKTLSNVFSKKISIDS